MAPSYETGLMNERFSNFETVFKSYTFITIGIKKNLRLTFEGLSVVFPSRAET